MTKLGNELMKRIGERQQAVTRLPRLGFGWQPKRWVCTNCCNCMTRLQAAWKPASCPNCHWIEFEK